MNYISAIISGNNSDVFLKGSFYYILIWSFILSPFQFALLFYYSVSHFHALQNCCLLFLDTTVCFRQHEKYKEFDAWLCLCYCKIIINYLLSLYLVLHPSFSLLFLILSDFKLRLCSLTFSSSLEVVSKQLQRS